MAQRFSAAITGLFSVAALAAEVKMQVGKEFFSNLLARATFAAKRLEFRKDTKLFLRVRVAAAPRCNHVTWQGTNSR